MKTALIIGALGQDGFYLTEALLQRGYYVIGTTHQDPEIHADFQGSILHRLFLTEFSEIRELLLKYQPDEVYNLAARASSAQLSDDPVATGDINGLAVARLLEAIIQYSPLSRFCQALSSEIFAMSPTSPQSEQTAVIPVNAYGAAKTYAMHLVQSYRRHRKVFACGAILYNHESPRRPPHFVTRKITQAVARIALGSHEKLQLGNPNHRRDWGHARDHVRAMYLMLQHPNPDDYVVATGVTHSVAEFCDLAFQYVGMNYRDHVTFAPDAERRHEAVVLCGDIQKAQNVLGWTPSVKLPMLIQEMIDEDLRLLQS